MDLTGSTRATTTTAGTILLGGLSTILYGISRNNVTHSIGGLALTVSSLTVIALASIRRWIVDTSNERRALAEATTKAQEECTRYIALKAALENEQGRLRQDVNAELAALDERLAVERRKMDADFEERRNSLMEEAMETTVRMFYKGKFAPEAPRASLIPFPQQDPHRQRERAREHGVVGP